MMKNIKKYKDFCNEELNIKKTLAGVALGAGLALGNPVVGNTQTNKNNQTKQYAETNDITGWGKVKWGMTPDQVKNIYGDSQKIDTFDVMGISNMDIKLYNPDYKIINKKFNVNFKYTDNKLSSVELSIVTEANVNSLLNYDTPEKFNEFITQIEIRLVEKYGKIDYRNTTDNYNKIKPTWSLTQNLYKLNSNWNKSKGNIDLIYSVDFDGQKWHEKLENSDKNELVRRIYSMDPGARARLDSDLINKFKESNKLITIKIVYSDKNNLEGL